MRVWVALDLLAHVSQRRSHARADYAMIVRVSAKRAPDGPAAEAAPENLTATKPACAGWDRVGEPQSGQAGLRGCEAPAATPVGGRPQACVCYATSRRWGRPATADCRLPTADRRARARRD